MLQLRIQEYDMDDQFVSFRGLHDFVDYVQERYDLTGYRLGQITTYRVGDYHHHFCTQHYIVDLDFEGPIPFGTIRQMAEDKGLRIINL